MGQVSRAEYKALTQISVVAKSRFKENVGLNALLATCRHYSSESEIRITLEQRAGRISDSKLN
jgi:hypothetical protein